MSMPLILLFPPQWLFALDEQFTRVLAEKIVDKQDVQMSRFSMLIHAQRADSQRKRLPGRE